MGIAAGVAHNDHAVVQITRRVNGGCDADVDCSAGNDQSIDAPGAKRQIKIGLMDGAPPVFGNECAREGAISAW